MTANDAEFKLEQWVHTYQNDPEFIAEGLAIDVIEEALEILERRGGTQSSLAQTMGVSRQSVSRMFNAPSNLTLLSIARIAVALEIEPKVILDSGAYIIHSVNEPLDFEAYRTDVAYQQAHNAETSAFDTNVRYSAEVPDTAVEHPSGVSIHVTA